VHIPVIDGAYLNKFHSLMLARSTLIGVRLQSTYWLVLITNDPVVYLLAETMSEYRIVGNKIW